MATAVIGCGAELKVVDRVTFTIPPTSIFQETKTHSMECLFLESWKTRWPFCGAVFYVQNAPYYPPQTKNILYRALCKDCAVKDGIAW